MDHGELHVSPNGLELELNFERWLFPSSAKCVRPPEESGVLAL